jgi:hypothetical protein
LSKHAHGIALDELHFKHESLLHRRVKKLAKSCKRIGKIIAFSPVQHEGNFNADVSHVTTAQHSKTLDRWVDRFGLIFKLFEKLIQ